MSSKKKILLVDDDIDIISVAETILTNEGYEVLTAGGKKEGIEKALAEKPDLAICDVMMSTQYEGFELAQVLTNSPELKGMPVLIQTSMQVFASPDPDAMKYARYYRNEMNNKDIEVLFVESTVSGKSGIDYRNEKGEIIWLPVDGFIRKPIKAEILLKEINKVIKK